MPRPCSHESRRSWKPKLWQFLKSTIQLYWTVRYSKLRFYWLILMMRLVLIVYRRKFSKKTYIAKTTMALMKRVWTKCLKSRAKLYQTQVSKRRAKILHHRCTMSLRRNLRIQYRIQNAGNYEESSMEAEAKSETLQGKSSSTNTKDTIRILL